MFKFPMNFRRPKNIFNYKNDRFWSFFGRDQEIPDLDTKMYDFHMKNNDFATWRRIFVRQLYIFATLMSGKHCKTTISRPKCATVLRFCNTDVRKTKQNNDFTTKMCDSSTFLEHWCPENKAKQRFHDIRTKKSEKKTPQTMRRAIETWFRAVLWEIKKPRKCDRGFRFYVFNRKINTIHLTKTTISTERGLKK